MRDFLAVYRENGWALVGEEACKNLAPEANYTTFTALWNEYRSFCISQSIATVGSKAVSKRMNHLQGQFGFKLDKVSGGQGMPVQVFRNLVLLSNRKAAA